MKPSKKIEKRLEARINTFERERASPNHDSKVRQRYETGGYTKPGSRKKT